MKKTTKFISAALAAALCAGLLAGCNSASSSSGSTSASGSASASASASASSSTSASAESIDYSKGLAENGHIDGVTALDYVTLPADYAAIPLAAGTADVSDEDVQAQIDSIMAQYAKPEQITDRAIEDGDQVNIDYSGSIDGEKFDGGTASSQSVQAGSAQFIDDFLTQIIGHTPGETFDVEVTFPDPYENNPDLAGKDAVFEVTINYIEGEDVTPEFSDDFVKENLTASYGWESADDVRDSIREDLRQSQIFQFIWNYMIENSTVSEVPQAVLDFQSGAMLNQLKSQASMYGIDSATFLQAMGVASEEAFLEQYAEDIKSSATQLLIIQAIAEDAKLKADDAAQHRHLIILDQCADQPDDNSQRDTCQPQTQGQPRRFFKQRQVLCDHIPIHKSLPFPIGSRTNLDTKKSGPSLRGFPDKGQVQHMGVLVGPADHAR